MRRARRCITLAAGVTGVVAAHVLAYILAFSDPRQRAHVLSSTGHGYWSVAVWAAVLAAAVVVAATVARGAVRGTSRSGGAGGRIVPGVGTLAGAQVAMFAGVEVIERLAAGAPLSELVHGHEFLIGLGLQLVLAVVLVVALGAVERFSARVAGAFTRTRRVPRGRVAYPTQASADARPVLVDRPRSRAPPSVALQLST